MATDMIRQRCKFPRGAASAAMVVLLAWIALTWVIACGREGPATTPTRPAATAVSFVTSDGIALRGFIFGDSDLGVVLAHMYPADQTSWFDFAGELATQGYQALTFDFRGYGESQGSKDIAHIDRDVLAAVQAIGRAGAKRIVLAGASMGGTASLMAAAQLTSPGAAPESSPAVCGVVTLSAPVEFRGLSARQAVSTLSLPLLLIAADGDVGAQNARELAKLSSNRGDLLIVPGDEHGTNLLLGPSRDQVRQAIMDFLETCLRKD
ncbi:MAG: alpha/beta fold hydrolase [Thermoleophilia bacterium]|nr:alpha/beta fold hydrolase [Thermoleophilia bacterium]